MGFVWTTIDYVNHSFHAAAVTQNLWLAHNPGRPLRFSANPHTEFQHQGIELMASYEAFYVRGVTDESAIVAAIRAKFRRAKIQAGAPFWEVQRRPALWPWARTELPERDLMELSSRLKTDVLWLSFQSVVDAFEFHHWRAGEHLRSLVYGHTVQGKWERAEGTPEPWERQVLFDQTDLKELLEEMDERGESENEKREVERIWHDAEIRPGQTWPSLDARECALKVAEYFHLPGWGRCRS
jgi:hypothetical protein